MLSQSQSGFRPKHSCHTALTKLFDNWLTAINNSEVVGAVFLDLKKSFGPCKSQYFDQEAILIHS